MNRFTCSVCCTYSPELKIRMRYLPEPHSSWECPLCYPIQDEQALIIRARDLMPCEGCGMYTKRRPVCSTVCLIEKELGSNV